MNSRFLRNHQFWLTALIIYMVLICYLSLKPEEGPKGTALQETLHNLGHVPAYAGLTFLAIGLLMVYEVKSSVFLKAFCSSVLYGVLLEYLQGFVPGRTPSLLDVSSNAFGALGMIFLIHQGFMKKFLPISNSNNSNKV